MTEEILLYPFFKSLKFNDLINMELHKFSEDVLELVEGAAKESKIEQKLATIVKITKTPTLAATNLWVHSMKYSAEGIIPFGHIGHSGQVNPNPAAEIYPPININEYKTIRVDNARYWIAKIILR